MQPAVKSVHVLSFVYGELEGASASARPAGHVIFGPPTGNKDRIKGLMSLEHQHHSRGGMCIRSVDLRLSAGPAEGQGREHPVGRAWLLHSWPRAPPQGLFWSFLPGMNQGSPVISLKVWTSGDVMVEEQPGSAITPAPLPSLQGTGRLA